MLTILFFVALIWTVAKLFALGIKMTWGVARFICMVFILPLILIGVILMGLFYIAVPVLLVIGLITFVKSLAVR